MKKDYSEYKHTDYEKYNIARQSNSYVYYDFSLTLLHSILTRSCFQSKLIGLMKTFQ